MSIRKSWNRIGWELYCLNTSMKWRLWDFVGERDRAALLESSTVHRETRPPDLDLRSDSMASQLSGESVFNNPVEEYVIRCQRRSLIEPRFGYVIAEPCVVISQSLPGSEFSRLRGTMASFSGVPSFGEVFLSKGRTIPVRKLPRVVNLRYVFEGNYYHFYQDMLISLKMLADQGIGPEIPVVVGPHLGRQRFFQEAIMRGELAARNWIVQDGFFIQAEEVVFARSARCNRERLDFLLDALEAPEPDPSSNRRLFLTRSKSSGRNISNMDEIRPVLDAHGMQCVDTSKLSLSQQMDLFRGARLVVGIHGAGLTNIIYRRGAKLRLVELFSPGVAPPHYYALSKTLGFEYDFIMGVGSGPDAPNKHWAPFMIDREELDRKLRQCS